MPIFSTFPPCCSSPTILLIVARISTASSAGQQEMRSLASWSGLNILGLEGSRLCWRQKLTTFSLREWQKRSRLTSSERGQASVRRRWVEWERRLSRSSPPMCCIVQLLQSTRQRMLTRPKVTRQYTLPRQPPARQQQNWIFLSVARTDSNRPSSPPRPSTPPCACSNTSFFWYGFTRFISSYSAQMRLKIFLLQLASRRFKISQCRFSGEYRMMGCVVQKSLGLRPSSETRKGYAPEYSIAECEISTSCKSFSSPATSRYFDRSKLWLIPQSSRILYFYSITSRQQFAPSSCSERIFFIRIFIFIYYYPSIQTITELPQNILSQYWLSIFLFITDSNVLFYFIIVRKMEKLIFICLLKLILSSLLPQSGLIQLAAHQNAGNYGPLNLAALKAQHQELFKSSTTPITDAVSNETALSLRRSSKELIRQYHAEMMKQYFKSQPRTNIDNGKDNTIDGAGNIIVSGDRNLIGGKDNLLNGVTNSIAGDSNVLDGNSNDVKGSSNSIQDSSNNIVYGNGNIIQGWPDDSSSTNKQIAVPTNSKVNIEESLVNPNTNLSNQYANHFLLQYILLAFVLLLLQ